MRYRVPVSRAPRTCCPAPVTCCAPPPVTCCAPQPCCQSQRCESSCCGEKKHFSLQLLQEEEELLQQQLLRAGPDLLRPGSYLLPGADLLPSGSGELLRSGPDLRRSLQHVQLKNDPAKRQGPQVPTLRFVLRPTGT